MTKVNLQRFVKEVKKKQSCVIWESNPGLPDVARMATENFTTKPITRFAESAAVEEGTR